MILVENPNYLKEIESFIQKEQKLCLFNKESNFILINNFRQLFLDYWFSIKKLPIINNDYLLISVISYFIFKIKKLSKKDFNREIIIRMNTLYSDFSQQIIDFIEKGNKIIINNLGELLIDNQFYKHFLLRLNSNCNNFEKNYLLISKVNNLYNFLDFN